jgi:hypothetical protein
VREEGYNKLLYYKAIPSTKKTFLILTQLWRNSILHCENENLIKADWLTMWVLRLYDTMLNFVENLLENERGPMNGQDLTKTDYDPDRSLVLSRVSLIF